MYRNTYLELYKTNASNNPSLHLLLAHFSHVYNTLGCVLQDLEFHIGQLISREASQPPQDSYQAYSKKMPDKHKDKDIVKVEDNLSQNADRNVPVLNEQPFLLKSIKAKHNELAKQE
jgi:hypothetical protein